MKPCFGYVRVSTQKQGEGVSLDAQKEAILSFAERNNITITRWFEEKETAAKSGRPVFNEMIKLLKRGRALGVVMHKIDRSARNFADWAKIGDLADAGIDVHFATETLDFRSRGGRLSADIQAVIAADYIRNLKDEIRKGIDGQLNRGILPCRAPIGYLNNGGGKLKTPDPKMAPLIRKAFELYATGRYSLRTLLAELYRLGLRNRYGNAVSMCGLETILNNPFYCGIIRINKTGRSYQGKHTPLISVALFQSVQERKSGKSGAKVSRHNHLYRGLFRCAECGFAMRPERQKGHVYYRCHSPTCPTKCVREEALEREIVSILSAVRFTDAQLDQMTETAVTWAKEAYEADHSKDRKSELAQLDDKLDRLTDAMIERLIEEETFARKKEKLLLEKAELHEIIKNESRKTDPEASMLQMVELAKNLVSTYVFAEPAEKRQLVEMLTSNRKVSGKNIYLEPQDWLREAQNAMGVLLCAHSRDKNRMLDRQPMDSGEYIKQLENIAASSEARKLFEVADRMKAERPDKRMPK